MSAVDRRAVGWLRQMFRRVPITVAEDLDHVAELAAAGPSGLVVLFDVDNTLVRQGADPQEFIARVKEAVARFEAIPAVGRVALVSNGADRGIPGMISRGNKPWTTRRRLGLTGEETEVWIVGDQIITDGLLAWRLGVPFVHHVVDAGGEGSRQSMMRRLGRLVRRRFFVDS